MSGIDYSNAEFWAKAPEWAGAVVSAYSSDGDRFYFVEEFGGISRRQEVGSIDRGEIADMIIPGNVWRLVAERPQAWTGAGLPPVGTVCELRCKTGGWGIATVKYISPTVCAWLWSAQPEDVECCEEVHKMEFRPIRTPEQIAAEKKEADILRIWDLINISKAQAKALYDSGLRFMDDPGNG